MHYRLFVTFNKKKAKTSEDARVYVESKLIQGGFVYESEDWDEEGNFIGKPLSKFHGWCDWFVTGGRWSGELAIRRLNQKKIDKFRKAFDKKYGWYTNVEIKANMRQQQSKNLFREYFPNFKGEHPFWRYNYEPQGFEDDAQIVDEKLYKECLKHFEGQYIVEEHFIDLDKEKVNLKFIKKKWIVVVDFHM